jgi:hypothetical protein
MPPLGAVTELPKAAGALKPIASGAGAAAMDAAKDKAANGLKNLWAWLDKDIETRLA